MRFTKSSDPSSAVSARLAMLSKVLSTLVRVLLQVKKKAFSGGVS